MSKTLHKLKWMTLAALYFISPIDLLPDVILGPGQFDDVAFLLYALYQIRNPPPGKKGWLLSND